MNPSLLQVLLTLKSNYKAFPKSVRMVRNRFYNALRALFGKMPVQPA